MEAAVYPDSEAIICSYLRTYLPPLINEVTFQVSTDIPFERPEEFIRLMRTGGPAMNIVADRPQITIECWAMNEDRAYEIAKYARALIARLEGNVFSNTTFYRMDEFSGPISNPDPDTPEQARYSWTFTIGVRGTQLVLS